MIFGQDVVLTVFCYRHLVFLGRHDTFTHNYILYLDGHKTNTAGECKSIFRISDCVMLEITHTSVPCSSDQKPGAVFIPVSCW